LLKKSDIYLDINHWGEVDGIVNRAIEQHKPVYAFENTVHGNQGQEVFSSSNPDKLVSRVREYLNEVG
jgi:nodulation protein L